MRLSVRLPAGMIQITFIGIAFLTVFGASFKVTPVPPIFGATLTADIKVGQVLARLKIRENDSPVECEMARGGALSRAFASLPQSDDYFHIGNRNKTLNLSKSLADKVNQTLHFNIKCAEQNEHQHTHLLQGSFFVDPPVSPITSTSSMASEEQTRHHIFPVQETDSSTMSQVDSFMVPVSDANESALAAVEEENSATDEPLSADIVTVALVTVATVAVAIAVAAIAVVKRHQIAHLIKRKDVKLCHSVMEVHQVTSPPRAEQNMSTGLPPASSTDTVSPYKLECYEINNCPMKARFSDWEVPRSSLKLLSRLGEGCFGQVWKCQMLSPDCDAGVIVAVKTLKETSDDMERCDLLQELELMKKLDTHPNVLQLLGCCTEKDPIFLILEYMSEGTLLAFLRQSKAGQAYSNLHGPSSTLSSRDLTTFAQQVARGMFYLSQKGVIHRDLAARNVLVSPDRVCKVADFGLARDVLGMDAYERKTNGRLPIRWMAPESLFENIFTVKTDSWSFGILLWEIVTLGCTPYPGLSAQQVVTKVREGYRLDKPEHCNREMYNLMYYCWSADPAVRPDFDETVHTLESFLLSDLDYIELDKIPERCYYNTYQLTGEKV